MHSSLPRKKSNHLINGECLNILKSCKDKSIDLIMTDPPYTLKREQIEEFHKEMIRVAKCVVVFAPPESQWIVPADQILFWIKPIRTTNTSKSYSRFVEMLFVYGRNEWNTDRHWSQYNNVFHDRVGGKLHPHQKPKSLVERIILNHTIPNQMVMDPFMGSGTTGVVCKQNSRNFIGIEIDKECFIMAKRRILNDN